MGVQGLWRRHWPLLPFLTALALGAGNAVHNWLSGGTEWSHWRHFVHLPLAEATGPQKPLFGYLPGAKGLLAPLVLSEPTGFFIFLLLNVLACVVLLVMIRRAFAEPGRPESPERLFWLSWCMAVPVFFGLHNNQVVLMSACLALLGISLARRNREFLSGLLLALAAIVKTLPLALFPLPLLHRRWKATLAACLLLPLLSLLLAAAAEDFPSSLDQHLRWPAQILVQDPDNTLEEAGEPASFRGNQSASAEIVRLARATGWHGLQWIHDGACLLSLGLLILCSIRAAGDRLPFWTTAASWMAWVAFAAPFGRYYYLIFLTPAWYALGRKHAGLRPHWKAALLYLLPAAALCSRGPQNPTYAFATLLTLALSLARRPSCAADPRMFSCSECFC